MGASGCGQRALFDVATQTVTYRSVLVSAKKRCKSRERRSCFMLSGPRAKEALSTGWDARLCCKQRGRLAAVFSQFRGVRQRVQAVGSARKCARERATRERSGSQSSSVCLCGHSPKGAIARVLGPTQWSSIGGCCSRPRTNAEIIGVNARVPWANALLGVRMRVSRQRPRRGRAGPRACHRQSSEFEGRLEGGERDCLSRERGACRETAVGGMHL